MDDYISRHAAIEAIQQTIIKEKGCLYSEDKRGGLYYAD